MNSFSRKNSHLLFIGDSITDCGRQLLNPLGNGFVSIIAKQLKKNMPKLRVSNRGMGGNTSADLALRWQQDSLDLKPTIVSILIGINDTWRHFDQGVSTGLDAFEQNYRSILDRTVTTLNPTLILCEPFLLPVSDEQKLWHVDLNPKRRLVRGLANEYNAHFVPLQEAFQNAAASSPPETYTSDGVHPTEKGHALIAETWMLTVVGEQRPTAEKFETSLCI